MDFTDGVNFLKGVSASEAQLTGLVSGQDLVEFVRTAILNDVEQIFEDTLYLDGCHIQSKKKKFNPITYYLTNLQI